MLIVGAIESPSLASAMMLLQLMDERELLLFVFRLGFAF